MLKTTMALVASLGLLLAGQAGATEAKTKKGTQKEMTFAGDVASVNAKARQLVVKSTAKGAGSEMTFQVGRQTEIFIDGQRALLSELQKDERVTVTYEMNGSTPLAKRVHRQKNTT